jgi:hypothetical protein
MEGANEKAKVEINQKATFISDKKRRIMSF